MANHNGRYALLFESRAVCQTTLRQIRRHLVPWLRHLRTSERGKHPFNARSLDELMGRIQDEPVDYSGINDHRLIEMLKRMLCKNRRID